MVIWAAIFSILIFAGFPAAANKYSYEDHFSPIRINFEQLHSFTQEILKIASRTPIQDAFGNKYTPYLKYIITNGNVKLETTNIDEIFASPDSPTRIEELTIRLEDASPLISYFTLSLGGYGGNRYGIEGSDKLIVDALKMTIVNFTNHHKTFGLSPRLILVMQFCFFIFGVIFFLIYVFNIKIEHFEVNQWVYFVIAMIFYAFGMLFPFDSMFPSFVLNKDIEPGLLTKLTPFLTLVGVFFALFGFIDCCIRAYHWFKKKLHEKQK